MFSPCTTTRASLGSTFRTAPSRPLSLPVRTTTRSPFRSSPPSQHLGGERNDLHVVLGAQFAGNRAEDPRADRLALLVHDDGRVLVEADHAAVLALDGLAGPNDDGLQHIALLHAAARDRLLHGDD